MYKLVSTFGRTVTMALETCRTVGGTEEERCRERTFSDGTIRRTAPHFPRLPPQTTCP